MQRSLSIPGSIPRILLALLPSLLLAFLLGACTIGVGGGDEADGEPATETVAEDSSAVAAADSSDADGDEKGGFFSRFRNQDDESEDEEEEAVPVELAMVTRGDVPSYLSATASLEAEKQVDILAKAAGQITRLLVEEGDWIERGQLVAVLDGETQRVALEEATLRARRLELEYERSKKLYDQQGISDREIQDVRFRYEQAASQQKAAQLGLDYTSIEAPFSGRIAERYVAPGQHLSIGSPLFSIVDADPLLARIFLPEKEAVHIAPAQTVVISPDSQTDLELRGEVLRIAPIVDRRTGTVKVTCQIAGEATRLRPGSFVRVKVQTDLHAGVPVIPSRALVPEGGEVYVYKALSDSVVKTSISTGYTDGDFVEVLSGLELGERVVTVGTGSLKTGTKIRDLLADDESAAIADSTPSGDGES